MAEGPFNPYSKKMDKKKKKAVMNRRAKGLKELLCDKDTQPLQPDQIYLFPERQIIEDVQKQISSRRPTSSRKSSGLSVKQKEAKLLEERNQRVKRLLQEKAKEQAAAKEAAREAREAMIVNQNKPYVSEYETYLLKYPRGSLLHELCYPEDLHGLYAIRYSDHGEYIVAGFGSGVIQIRDGKNGVLLSEVTDKREQTFPVTSIRFHPEFTELFFAASSNGEVFLCDTDAEYYDQFDLEPENEIYAMDINCCGTLATGGKDGNIRVYDSKTLEMTVMYPRNPDEITDGATKFHRHSIYAVHFHMRDILICGGWDNCVKVWDLRVPEECVRKFFGPHLCGDTIDIKNHTLVTGSWVAQDSLQLWDFRSGNLISTVSPINSERNMKGEFLYTTKYFTCHLPGDSVIIAGSGLNDVEVVDLAENKVLANFPVAAPIWAVDSYDRFITFGGMEPIITIADYIKPPKPTREDSD